MGPTILETSLLLAGEEVTAFVDNKKVGFRAAMLHHAHHGCLDVQQGQGRQLPDLAKSFKHAPVAGPLARALASTACRRFYPCLACT